MDINELTYQNVMDLMREDASLDYLRPINDMRPFTGLNNAFTVWDKDSVEHVVKLTENGFVSWKAVGQELFDNNHNRK